MIGTKAQRIASSPLPPTSYGDCNAGGERREVPGREKRDKRRNQVGSRASFHNGWLADDEGSQQGPGPSRLGCPRPSLQRKAEPSLLLFLRHCDHRHIPNVVVFQVVVDRADEWPLNLGPTPGGHQVLRSVEDEISLLQLLARG